MAVRRTLILPVLAALVACQPTYTFEPEQVASGPGGMVGNGEPLTPGTFEGGDDVLPPPLNVAPPNDTRPPDCGAGCVAHCNGAGLRNPVNRGLCRSLWGVGLPNRPIKFAEACRRLFVDMLGRVPTADEAEATCAGGWGATVKRLMEREEFLAIQQRLAADRFLYSNEVTSLQAIYDMDRLVAKLYQGKVPYDLFAAVVSAHPVFTRRYADPGDKAEALFRQFLGRPPFEHERADMSRLYKLWHSGYYDHPQLGMRLPDAFIRFRCLDDEGHVDEVARGECASVLWGYNELIFTPDLRAARDPRLDNELTMWSGLLKPEEWAKLQAPGRIIARDLAFWERAVDDVLLQYLGYELSAKVPEVREELVRFLLAHNGDIRSVHYAVATSVAYLQSAEGASASTYRWTYGPLKQVDAEVWVDSMFRNTGYSLPGCDRRISQPEALLRSGSIAGYRLLQSSDWKLDEEGEVDERYAELARTLGGCPENVTGGRFRVVSILTTATQLSAVQALCNPALDPKVQGAPVEKLLPEGMGASRAVNASLAAEIAIHQYRTLLGRSPEDRELAEARDAGTECALTLCSAEQFARPFCFALLSSAERVFY
ncbi:hypothetical protein [Archangium sp.]|jgi:hypothetical protein|uniref:hypothetical protein n=1 Tax=Archangium sp. TaxID=1872627 RepID=UPI002ED9971C